MILDKSYKEIMNRVEMSEEMRNRILKNVSLRQENQPSAFRHFRFPRALSVCASVLILAVGVTVIPQIVKRNSAPPEYETLGNSGFTASFSMIPCSSLKELSGRVKFQVSGLAQLPFEVTSVEYVSGADEFAQITYTGADNQIVFRQSASLGDISGDYNTYPDVVQSDYHNFSVTLKGENEKYVLAVWNTDKFSYSISCETGLSQEEMFRLIDQTS